MCFIILSSQQDRVTSMYKKYLCVNQFSDKDSIVQHVQMFKTDKWASVNIISTLSVKRLRGFYHEENQTKLNSGRHVLQLRYTCINTHLSLH